MTTKFIKPNIEDVNRVYESIVSCIYAALFKQLVFAQNRYGMTLQDLSKISNIELSELRRILSDPSYGVYQGTLSSDLTTIMTCLGISGFESIDVKTRESLK